MTDISTRRLFFFQKKKELAAFVKILGTRRRWTASLAVIYERCCVPISNSFGRLIYELKYCHVIHKRPAMAESGPLTRSQLVYFTATASIVSFFSCLKRRIIVKVAHLKAKTLRCTVIERRC